MKLFRNKHGALFFLIRFEDVPSATGAVPCAVLRFFEDGPRGSADEEVSVPVDAFRGDFSAAEVEEIPGLVELGLYIREERPCTPPTLVEPRTLEDE